MVDLKNIRQYLGTAKFNGLNLLNKNSRLEKKNLKSFENSSKDTPSRYICTVYLFHHTAIRYRWVLRKVRVKYRVYVVRHLIDLSVLVKIVVIQAFILHKLISSTRETHFLCLSWKSTYLSLRVARFFVPFVLLKFFLYLKKSCESNFVPEHRNKALKLHMLKTF